MVKKKVADLFGEFETAMVFPGAREAGLIAVEMLGRNEGEWS